MSLNVHFTNLQITDFVSKNARNRMKSYIKQNLNQDNINSFDEIEFSHPSTIIIIPAIQKPDKNRATNQTGGSINSICIRIAVEAIEA